MPLAYPRQNEADLVGFNGRCAATWVSTASNPQRDADLVEAPSIRARWNRPPAIPSFS